MALTRTNLKYCLQITDNTFLQKEWTRNGILHRSEDDSEIEFTQIVV
jgi:hypothetical protein